MLKSHAVRIALALSLVLAMGCGTNSDLTGPAGNDDPVLKKGRGNPGGGENPGSATYDYHFSGAITVDDGYAAANVGDGDADNFVMNGCCDPPHELLVLKPELLDQLDPGGCFDASERDFVGAMRRDKRDVNGVTATFYFPGSGTDASEFKYVLTLEGAVTSNEGGELADSDIFPPEPGETTTVAFTFATMETEGKGKGKGGTACVGDAMPISATAVVKGIS